MTHKIHSAPHAQFLFISALHCPTKPSSFSIYREGHRWMWSSMSKLGWGKQVWGTVSPGSREYLHITVSSMNPFDQGSTNSSLCWLNKSSEATKATEKWMSVQTNQNSPQTCISEWLLCSFLSYRMVVGAASSRRREQPPLISMQKQ